MECARARCLLRSSPVLCLHKDLISVEKGFLSRGGALNGTLIKCVCCMGTFMSNNEVA